MSSFPTPTYPNQVVTNWRPHIEHIMWGRRAAWPPLWWWPCYSLSLIFKRIIYFTTYSFSPVTFYFARIFTIFTCQGQLTLVFNDLMYHWRRMYWESVNLYFGHLFLYSSPISRCLPSPTNNHCRTLTWFCDYFLFTYLLPNILFRVKYQFDKSQICNDDICSWSVRCIVG